MGFASFLPGDIIFKQGDYGDQFYIILSGAIDVLVAEEDKLGEVQLLSKYIATSQLYTRLKDASEASN